MHVRDGLASDLGSGFPITGASDIRPVSAATAATAAPYLDPHVADLQNLSSSWLHFIFLFPLFLLLLKDFDLRSSLQNTTHHEVRRRCYSFNKESLRHGSHRKYLLLIRVPSAVSALLAAKIWKKVCNSLIPRLRTLPAPPTIPQTTCRTSISLPRSAAPCA